MSSLIAGMNPAAPITSEPQARAAARASAIAIFLGVLWGLVGIAYMMSPEGKAAIDAGMAAATAESPEAAGMAGMMAGAFMGIAMFMVVIQIILGLVQWAKPNIVIPILFLVLVVYGLGSTALGLAMADQAAAGTPQAPMWQIVVGFIVLVIQAVLHIAGIRGASALKKFHQADDGYGDADRNFN